MGKNFIVGQSGGPTAVINASLAGVAAAALAHIRSTGSGTVYGMQHGIQGFARGEVVDLGAQLDTEAAIALLKTTPAAALGSCRRRLPAAADEPQVYEDIFRRLQQLDIGCFLYIGGNDSMDTIQKLHDWGAAHGSDIRFVGVPKTIDNDLAMTDHTPGYGSAARYIATVMKELLCDSLVYDEKRVTVVEIMGRNAGWLAGAAALAADEECAGPDLLYLPETPFDVEDFVRRVDALQQKRKSVVVAISEGIRLDDGRYVCELSNTSASVDVFGHRQLSGAASTLSAILNSRLGAKCRAVELSTMQRCAAHLAAGADVEEAFAAGAAGVKAALAGESGCMVTLVRSSTDPYVCECATADIHAIANAEKTVPLAWIDTENATVTKEFLDYARPLILGENAVVWANGIPKHFVVK
ncbi:MAG: diphosphate--fructose-6-phosphate 1-phosphotransferase [Oscillospiraceae bacterium]|nr:diphosphate--fructose-6-phosphate 1-phosphotransferase [Oscillospiraceae bacterium]